MSSGGIGELVRSRSMDYCRSSRKQKGVIPGEFVAATSVKRKAAIGLLRRPPPPQACRGANPTSVTAIPSGFAPPRPSFQNGQSERWIRIS
jgi:hypothetical protein